MSVLRLPLADQGAYIDSREPAYDVKTKMSLNGKRASSTWALTPLTRYTVKQDRLRSDLGDYQRWLAFFQRHFGGLDSFLLDDPEDNAAADASIAGGGHCFGLGDGATTTFQLQRRTLGSHYDNLPGGPWRVSSGPRTNLLLQSQTFSAGAWNYGTGATGTLNACIAPDNGGATVLAYDGSGSAGGARVTQLVSTPASGGPSCISVWLRADAPVTVRLGTNDAAFLTVNLTTAWTRFSFVTTLTDRGLTIYSPASVNTSFRIYSWGAQSEADPASTGIPTALIPTTSAAVTVNPSFWPLFSDGYLPVYDLNGPTSIYRQDYQGTVQLFPWTRTNLVLQSQTFDNATWQKVSATVTANTTVAPDGTTTGDTFNEGTGVTTAHFIDQALTTVGGEMRCYSVFVKAGTLPNIMFGRDIGTFLKFNLSTGAIDGVSNVQGTILASGVTPLANGWYRIWFTMVEVAANTSANAYLFGTQNSSYTEIYTGTSRTFVMWGMQAEATSNLLGPSSYIPTAATTVTAAADYTLPGSGTITFATAPLGNAVLSWKGSCLIRCRFDQQDFPTARVVNGVWSVNLSLVSIKP